MAHIAKFSCDSHRQTSSVDIGFQSDCGRVWGFFAMPQHIFSPAATGL